MGKKTSFRLIGLDKNSPYFEKTYAEIEKTDPPSFNRINNSVLRSFVVQQLDPDDNSSVFHIFERLNTGGTLLVGQEIRNCVYGGSFNDLLLDLNKLPKWRAIFGKKSEDVRLRDVELILRFFALLNNANKYTKPMKTFLNNYMGKRRHPDAGQLQELRRVFEKTVNEVNASLGDRPFHLKAGLNAAAYDSVFVAFASNKKALPRDIAKRYSALKRDKKFGEWVTSSTTDENVVHGRLARAKKLLFGS